MECDEGPCVQRARDTLYVCGARVVSRGGGSACTSAPTLHLIGLLCMGRHLRRRLLQHGDGCGKGKRKLGVWGQGAAYILSPHSRRSNARGTFGDDAHPGSQTEVSVQRDNYYWGIGTYPCTAMLGPYSFLYR